MVTTPGTGRNRHRSRGRTRRTPVFPAQRRAAKLGLTRPPSRSRVRSRGLSRPAVWLLWLAGAALASVLIGFALGLARPREAGSRDGV